MKTPFLIVALLTVIDVRGQNFPSSWADSFIFFSRAYQCHNCPNSIKILKTELRVEGSYRTCGKAREINKLSEYKHQAPKKLKEVLFTTAVSFLACDSQYYLPILYTSFRSAQLRALKEGQKVRLQFMIVERTKDGTTDYLIVIKKLSVITPPGVCPHAMDAPHAGH